MKLMSTNNIDQATKDYFNKVLKQRKKEIDIKLIQCISNLKDAEKENNLHDVVDLTFFKLELEHLQRVYKDTNAIFI